MYLLSHLFALLVVLWLLWLPGWWVERRWLDFPSPDLHGLRFFSRFAIGAALWVGILFALASCRLYQGTAILTTAALWHLLAAIELKRRSGSDSGLFRSFGKIRFSAFKALLLVTSLFILLPIFALALTPTVSWDASAYHLTLPKLYLEHGGFQPVPMNVYSHWPLGIELLFGAAMALHSFVLAKSVHFAFGLLVLVGLIRKFSGREGWLAAAFFALNGVVLFEMRVAYVDLAHAFALLAGVVLAGHILETRQGELHGEEEPEPNDRKNDGTREILSLGLIAGLLVSIKVTGVVSAFCLALLLIPRWRRDFISFGTKATWRSMAAFAIPCLALGLPWWIKTWIKTGNPLYPWMWNLLGGPDWSPELAHQFSAWQQGIGMGRGWIDYLLLPWRVIVEGGQGYGRFDGEIGLFWLLALPLALLAAKRSPYWRRFVFVALFHAVFWALSSQQMRFLIPVLALLAAPAAAMAAELLRPRIHGHLNRRRWVLLTTTGLFLLAAISWHGGTLAGGARLLPAFLHPTYAPPSSVAPIFEEIDRLPENARLLLLNTNQGFHIERPYLADSFFEASQIIDWLKDASSPEEARRRLRDRGVTHVLYVQMPSGGLPYPQPFVDLLNDPDAVERLGFDGRHLLLALR